jgi:hypothetical protein
LKGSQQSTYGCSRKRGDYIIRPVCNRLRMNRASLRNKNKPMQGNSEKVNGTNTKMLLKRFSFVLAFLHFSKNKF